MFYKHVGLQPYFSLVKELKTIFEMCLQFAQLS